jgi:hypothetical protein
LPSLFPPHISGCGAFRQRPPAKIGSGPSVMAEKNCNKRHSLSLGCVPGEKGIIGGANKASGYRFEPNRATPWAPLGNFPGARAREFAALSHSRPFILLYYVCGALRGGDLVNNSAAGRRARIMPFTCLVAIF